LIAVGEVVQQHGGRHADLAQVLRRHPRRRVALWDRGRREGGQRWTDKEGQLWGSSRREAAQPFTDASQDFCKEKRQRQGRRTCLELQHPCASVWDLMKYTMRPPTAIRGCSRRSTACRVCSSQACHHERQAVMTGVNEKRLS
jgi:hypothetical protein